MTRSTDLPSRVHILVRISRHYARERGDLSHTQQSTMLRRIPRGLENMFDDATIWICFLMRAGRLGIC
jgi:hypothetical protein